MNKFYDILLYMNFLIKVNIIISSFIKGYKNRWVFGFILLI